MYSLRYDRFPFDHARNVIPRIRDYILSHHTTNELYASAREIRPLSFDEVNDRPLHGTVLTVLALLFPLGMTSSSFEDLEVTFTTTHEPPTLTISVPKKSLMPIVCMGLSSLLDRHVYSHELTIYQVKPFTVGSHLWEMLRLRGIPVDVRPAYLVASRIFFDEPDRVDPRIFLGLPKYIAYIDEDEILAVGVNGVPDEYAEFHYRELKCVFRSGMINGRGVKEVSVLTNTSRDYILFRISQSARFVARYDDFLTACIDTYHEFYSGGLLAADAFQLRRGA